MAAHATYTENAAPAAIDAALTVSDVDSANLTGATVSITGNFHSGEDTLGFTDQNGINGVLQQRRFDTDLAAPALPTTRRRCAR